MEIADKLQTSLELVEALKVENEVYKENFEELKQNYEILSSKFEQVHAAYQHAEREKSLQDDRFDELESFWKKKYEDQRDEMMAMRKQGPDPKELEKTKLKLLCELEQSHNKRIAHLEEVSEDFKIDADKTRQLQRENTELQLRAKSLVQEIDELRAKKESQSIDAEQRERLLNRRITEEVAISKSLSIEKETLKTKVLKCFSPIFDKIKLQATMDENRNLTKKLEETVNEVTDLEISEVKKDALQKQRNADLALGKTKARIAELEGQLQSAVQRIRDAQEATTTLQHEHLENINKIRSEERLNMERLQSEKAQIESTLHQTSQSLSTMDQEYQTNKRETTAEITKLRKELRDAIAFGESVVAQNERLLAEQESVIAHLEEERHRSNRMEGIVTKRSQEVEELLAREARLKEDVQRTDIATKLTESDLHKLISDLRTESETLKTLNAQRHEQWCIERESLLSQISHLESENSKFSQIDRTLKEERAQWLTKIRDLKKRLDTSSNENKHLSNLLTDAKQEEDKSKMEMEARRTELLAFLVDEVRPKRP
ncbi:hypothetical protein BC829DRAFT_444454 [Chytridium lagenaria]|nr:hypothetical protein BC829DRAFT_444454 [Chytridium lagenaria]